AVEAIPYAVRTLFALGDRVRPYNKYLEWELRHHPLDGWAADELLPLIDRVLAGEPTAQHELFNRIEPQARRAGFGDVIDSWEPDVAWLRGSGGYRDRGRSASTSSSSGEGPRSRAGRPRPPCAAVSATANASPANRRRTTPGSQATASRR